MPVTGASNGPARPWLRETNSLTEDREDTEEGRSGMLLFFAVSSVSGCRYMLVLMAGLPGTGKSTLARELARRTGGHVLDKDAVRETLFGPGLVEYSTAQDDLVVRVMLDAAAYILLKKPRQIIFFDGRVFSRASQLEDIIAFVEAIGTQWRILECVCSDATARTRLQRDSHVGNHPAANRNVELYVEMKARFEPITRAKTVIDTEIPLEVCVQRALEAIEF